ncbi:MAG TPA: hypothetical protein VFB59_02020 [Candidatus Saccharimonadales bacterium]|nr:hypothetical protein [Candidatus Saccharimonadales bacterium]
MEHKGTKDWSDYDDEDGERKSTELPRPRPEVVPKPPERRAPMFDLGLIYDRGDMPRETLKPVSEERDHVQPELAQGVSLGTPELSAVTPPAPGPSLEQIAQLETSKAQTHLQETTDDEEDAEENAREPSTPSQPSNPPADNRPAERVTSPRPEQTIDEDPVLSSREPPYSNPLAQPTGAYLPPKVIETTASPDDFQPDHQPYLAHPIVPPRPPISPAASGGNNNLPPPPPRIPGGTYGPPYGGGPHNPNVPPTYSSAYNTAPNTANLVTQRKLEFELSKMRRQRAAMMIVVAALTWYFARRPIKPLREQVKRLEKATEQQNEQIARLTTEQHMAQQRLAEQQRQIEQFTKPGLNTFEQQAAVAFNMQHGLKPIGEQVKVVGQPEPGASASPNQRYEIAGSYSTVVNEKNQVAPNAITYGEAYQRDVARERQPNPFGSRRFSGGGGGFGGPMVSGSNNPLSSNSVPIGPPAPQEDTLADVPKPNPVVSAITSPWLWLCAGILLVAFFAAATI